MLHAGKLKNDAVENTQEEQAADASKETSKKKRTTPWIIRGPLNFRHSLYESTIGTFLRGDESLRFDLAFRTFYLPTYLAVMKLHHDAPIWDTSSNMGLWAIAVMAGVVFLIEISDTILTPELYRNLDPYKGKFARRISTKISTGPAAMWGPSL